MNALHDLAASLSLFDNWEDRYRYIIDLGRRVPPLDESLKTDENLVRGCTSRVWMTQEWRGVGAQKTLHLQAASDAQIVQGLIYILLLAYQDKTVDEIAAVDIDRVFSDLGLDRHLSPNRRNGFFAMVGRVRDAGKDLS